MRFITFFAAIIIAATLVACVSPNPCPVGTVYEPARAGQESYCRELPVVKAGDSAPAAPAVTAVPTAGDAAAAAAPAAVSAPVDTLKYDETGCDSANLAACRNPGQDQFPAVYLRNVQSGDKTLVEGIIAIQQLVAAAGVPSSDKWSTLSVDPVWPTLVWCPAGNCTWVPDTAFPLLGIAPKEDDFTIGIVQAHQPADPAATVVQIVCPGADCWSFKLR